MTVVALPDSRLQMHARRLCDTSSLRAWLGGRWVILFSHPDDFAQEQMEMDRWMSVLSRSFRGHGVAPVALASDARNPDEGWLGGLAALDYGCAAVLSLDASQPEAAADPASGALRAQMARCSPRLAMIVDSNLRCRRALSYRLPAELPSPLDLIGWTVALRKRDRGEELLREASQPAPPLPSAWARGSRCAGTRRP
jgi:hypothetical protein